MEIRLEYAWEKYYFMAEASVDGDQWSLLADYTLEDDLVLPLFFYRKTM
ncbi:MULTISPECIES: hypothetical protein [Bacteroides]